jgi:hypothetical protein
MEQPKTGSTPVEEGNGRGNDKVDKNKREATKQQKAKDKGRQARCEDEDGDGGEVIDNPGKQMALAEWR